MIVSKRIKTEMDFKDLPFRLIVCIIQDHYIYEVPNGEWTIKLMVSNRIYHMYEYYGYFKLDKWRKLFQIFQNFSHVKPRRNLTLNFKRIILPINRKYIKITNGFFLVNQLFYTTKNGKKQSYLRNGVYRRMNNENRAKWRRYIPHKIKHLVIDKIDWHHQLALLWLPNTTQCRDIISRFTYISRGITLRHFELIKQFVNILNFEELDLLVYNNDFRCVSGDEITHLYSFTTVVSIYNRLTNRVPFNERTITISNKSLKHLVYHFGNYIVKLYECINLRTLRILNVLWFRLDDIKSHIHCMVSFIKNIIEDIICLPNLKCLEIMNFLYGEPKLYLRSTHEHDLSDMNEDEAYLHDLDQDLPYYNIHLKLTRCYFRFKTLTRYQLFTILKSFLRTEELGIPLVYKDELGERVGPFVLITKCRDPDTVHLYMKRKTGGIPFPRPYKTETLSTYEYELLKRSKSILPEKIGP